MHRYIPFITLLVLCHGGNLSGQTADSVAAMVTSVTGKATMLAKGTETNLELGQDVMSGAVVRVESGMASVVFHSGEFMELKEREEMTFGMTPAQSLLKENGLTRGVGIDESFTAIESGVELSEKKKRLYQLADIPGIRGDVLAIPVSPRLVVSDPAVTFIWFDSDSLSAGAEKTYQLVIRDEKGVVAKKEVRGLAYRINSIGIEDIARDLRFEPERHYTWGVFDQSKSAAQDAKLDAAFVIADTATLAASAAMRRRHEDLLERKKIDETSAHVLQALYYMDERERLYADAVPHLLAIGNTPSGRAYADPQLIGILQRFGNQVSVVAGYLARRNDK